MSSCRNASTALASRASLMSSIAPSDVVLVLLRHPFIAKLFLNFAEVFNAFLIEPIFLAVFFSSSNLVVIAIGFITSVMVDHNTPCWFLTEQMIGVIYNEMFLK